MRPYRNLSFPIAVLLILAGAVGVFAQKAPAEKSATADAKPVTVAPASAAYAELLLRRTELESELESLVLEYTEEYPKVKEIRQTLIIIDRESARLGKVKAADSARLTVALGKMMVRKVDLETDLWKLLLTYKEEHPDVKRAKRRVEIYENAIAQILN